MEDRAQICRERVRTVSAPVRRRRREASGLRLFEKFTVRRQRCPLIARCRLCRLCHRAPRASPLPHAGRVRQSREFPFDRRRLLPCVRRAPLFLHLCRQKAQMQ